MENEVKKQKNSNVILIVFMALIIVGLIIFILYDKNIIFGGNSNEGGSNNTDNPSQDVITKRDLDINSSEVKKVMSSFDELMIRDSSLYASSVYLTEAISNEDLINSAITLLDNDNTIDYVISPCEEGIKPKDVSLELLNSTLSKYISNKTITMDNIKSLRKVDYDSYYNTQYDVGIYGIALNESNLNLIGPCDGYLEEYVERKIVNAYEEGEYVYIFAKQAFGFVDANSGPSTIFYYYKEYSKINKIETFIVNGTKPNFDLYDTYKYTFKKYNGNYYFIRLELSK